MASDHTGICKLSVCLSRHIYVKGIFFSQWSNLTGGPMIFLVYSDNKASIPLAASMVLILHRKYGKLHGAKGFFFFYHFHPTALSYHAGHKRTQRSCLFCVISGRREERSTAFWFPKFLRWTIQSSRILLGSNQYLSPSNSICHFFLASPLV